MMTWRVGRLVALVTAAAACSAEPVEESRRALAFDTVAIVGVREGNPSEMFGRVHSVAAGPAGDFFVLDLQTSNVSWFSAEGSYRGGITSSGGGPGELSGAIDLTLTAGGDLLVLDPDNARISTFRPTAPGLRYVGSRRHEIGGDNLCALRDRVFVNVLRNNALVHEVGDSAAPLNSFGRVPEPGGLESFGPYFRHLAKTMLVSGLILCTTDPDLVIAVSNSHPRIAAYRPDGRAAWSTTLADFHPTVYERTDRGGIRATQDPELGAHIAQAATRWDEATMLVQYEIRRNTPRPDTAEYHEIESRFLDLSTGAELTRRTDLPLVAATSGGLVYVRRNLPIPQVLVLERH